MDHVKTLDLKSPFFPSFQSPRPTNEYGIANPDEIKKAFLNHETIILDVRNPDEIITDGRLSQFENTNTYVFSPCTLTECKSLSEAPEKVLQMDNKNITIVVYCASGRRAAAAKRILQEKGYTGNIINAGGYKDIKAMLEV